MAFRTTDIESALSHLNSRDPIMRAMIAEVGPFTLRAERDRFGLLVRSIISQQISTVAAQTIRRRLLELTAPTGPTPEALLQLEMEELRSVGLSQRKALYLLDLAAKDRQGILGLRNIGRLNDEKVIERLTQVKGIGRWTAQMFLIFSLARLDVFPEADLGIRVAIRDFYQMEELPDAAAGRTIAANWRPFASVASWYCWRALERRRAQPAEVAKGYPV